MDEELKAFWAQCCAARPDLDPAQTYSVKTYGNTAEMADLLLGLIRAGDKTGTFAVEWEFVDAPDAAPRAGDHVIVLDGNGDPGCLYRIDSVLKLPFNEITEQHIACEGPTMRVLEPWKKMHWAYWTRVLDGTPYAPAEDMPVLVQNFTVLYPDPAASH